MNKTKIYVDMDGTIAKWQEDKCIEEVMASGYFRDLPPMENVILAIKELIQRTNIEVYILSCVYGQAQIDDKNIWLNKYLPFVDNAHRIYVPYGENKSDYIKEKSSKDILIDDFWKNKISWHGKFIKMINHVNSPDDGYMVYYKMNPVIMANTIYGIALT